MDYFVSVENCQFFRWQLELLYESMRFFGLENNLVIGCAHLEKKTLKFPKVFYHDNYGRSNNYLPFNKTFSLWTALKNKLIKQPFAVIDPDMIMVKPLEILERPYSQGCSFLEYENLKKIGFNFDIQKKDWRPGGLVYYFNNCDEFILSEIHKVLVKMFHTYDKNLPVEVSRWQIEMVAFSYILSKVSAEIRFDLETPLIENKECNFIHYCNGFQPYFNKRTHNNLREFSFGKPLPFENILSMPNINNNVIKMKQIAKNFLDNRDGGL
jgi:hypothetical protein